MFSKRKILVSFIGVLALLTFSANNTSAIENSVCLSSEQITELQNKTILNRLEAIEYILRFAGICDFNSNESINPPYQDISELSTEEKNIIRTAYLYGIIDDKSHFIPKRIINRIDSADMVTKIYGLPINPILIEDTSFAYKDVAKNKKTLSQLAKEIGFPNSGTNNFYPARMVTGEEMIEWMDNVKLFVEVVFGSAAPIAQPEAQEQEYDAYFVDEVSDKRIEEIVQIWNLSKQYLVSPLGKALDYNKLEEAILNVFFETLNETVDPYSFYFTPTENAVNQNSSYAGIGASLGIGEDGKIYIESTFEDGPANKAGMLDLDEIIEVDGKAVEGLNTSDVAALIRGEEGTTVRIEIYRPSSNEYILFKLTRAIIEISYLNSEIIQYGDKYLLHTELLTFTQPGIIESFQDHLNQALNSETGIDGIVLDLRSNPGGFVSEVSQLIDLFVRAGEIMFRFEYANHNIEEYRSSTEAMTDLPLAVIVNGSSASASEIFAGAMQDLDRGEIIGTKTYGKFSAQQVFYFENTTGGEGRFTIAKWSTPDNSLAPITPDQIIEDDSVTNDDDQLTAAYEWIIQQ